MIVTNTPAADLALTNLAYCSHADLHGFAVPGTKLYLASIADSFVLSPTAHESVRNGHIALNTIQRRHARVSSGDTISVNRFIPPENFDLALLTLELESVKKGTKSEQVVLANQLKKRFMNQVMTAGQRVSFEFHGNNYIFRVNQAAVEGQEKYSTIERGMISSDTDIVFETSNSSGIKKLGAMSSSKPEQSHRKDEEEETTAAEDEDTGAQVAPIVRLEEVAISTGEEEEEPILDLKAKLYRFDKDGKQWKERGAGTVKLLKHKESGKVRLVMRQSKTLKICANHLVIPTMTVQEHAGNEKSCVWHATDFADGELKDELFCIRFASLENCRSFMETFQEVAESQGKKEDNKDASDTAGLLEKLNVGDGKTEGKEQEEKPDVAKEEDKQTYKEEDKKAVDDQAKPEAGNKDEPAS